MRVCASLVGRRGRDPGQDGLELALTVGRELGLVDLVAGHVVARGRDLVRVRVRVRVRLRLRVRLRARLRARLSPIPHPNPNPTAGQAQLRSWEAEEAEEEARAPLGWEPTALLDAPIEVPPHAVRRSREATPKEAPKQGPSGLTSGRTSGRSTASAPRKRVLES